MNTKVGATAKVGLSLSFEQAVVNEDSPITSHKNV